MRTLSFIFMLAFTVSVSAQSSMVSRLFQDGTRSAKAGDFENGVKSYKTALILAGSEQTDPEYLAKIHFNIGVCLYRSDKTKEAVREFSEAITLRKANYQQAYYALGVAQSRLTNWPKARTAFQEALKLNGSDGEAWFDLAFACLAEKDFENAGRAFQKSILYNSVDHALGHNNVGVILAMKNEFTAAEKEFETALLLSNGRLIEARNNLEYCKARNRNRPKLLAKLEFSNRSRNLRVS